MSRDPCSQALVRLSTEHSIYACQQLIANLTYDKNAVNSILFSKLQHRSELFRSSRNFAQIFADENQRGHQTLILSIQDGHQPAKLLRTKNWCRRRNSTCRVSAILPTTCRLERPAQ